MKKKIIITIIIISLILLLIPRIDILKDGGTKEYTSLIYKITKYNKLITIEEEITYKKGFKIELLDFTIFNNFKEDEIKEKNPIEISDNFEIKTIEQLNCKNKESIYFETKEKTIYTVCIENIELKDKNKVYPLNNLLITNDDIIEKLISKLEFVPNYDNEGSSIYKNNNLTILKCNTKTGNKDIYIGTDMFDVNSITTANFCKNYDYNFKGKIKEIMDNTLLLETENDGLYLVRKIKELDNYTKLKSNMKIKVIYDEGVDQSDPPQIDALKIYILNN